MSFTITIVAITIMFMLLKYLELQLKIQRLEDSIIREQRIMKIELTIDRLERENNV